MKIEGIIVRPPFLHEKKGMSIVVKVGGQEAIMRLGQDCRKDGVEEDNHVLMSFSNETANLPLCDQTVIGLTVEY